MTDVKFVVHKTNDNQDLEECRIITENKAHKYGEAVSKEANPLTDDEIEISDEESVNNKFHLYEEEYQTRPPMTSLFSKLVNYTGGIEPTSDETKKLKQKSSNKLGTILGVYFPCIQNIFGVLYFVRLVWIIGCAGIAQSFAIVGICCCTTFLTCLSMSAIATNGKVPAGGSYFMISRSLGPEFGGTVGILFYFGTTVAAAMYIIGAIEVLLIYIVPSASLFGPVDTNPAALFNNTRIYGVILLIIMMSCVLIGIRFVSKFATISLGCVLGSIFCVYIGLFASHSSRSTKVCMLGDRLLNQDVLIDKSMPNETVVCSNSVNSPLYLLYCGNSTNPINDDACTYLRSNNITEFAAFPGLHKPLLDDFFPSYYTTKNSIYGQPNKKIPKARGQTANIADITLSFTVLLAIFFPSVTGIMAGSNRSGDLANPGFSIPVGTIAACLTTSFVYLSSVVLFGAVIEHSVMRDKFGVSVGGGLIVAKVAWPNHWVILVGSFLSTVGAGLQSLTGAPRLLQAIAQDNVIPFLEPFKVTTARGEPLRAQALTFCISFLGVLIASIDYIAPLITMFFLMFYGFVNLATALNSLLKEPSWRPRFRYYHWTTSLLGLILCIALMFVSSWYYALVAIAVAGGIYKYIEYRGAAKEWGDATQGFRMSAANKAILQLGSKPIHTKNWRPQILVLVHVTESNFEISHPKLLDFCSQLKAGRGLTMVGTVLEGELIDRKQDVQVVKDKLDCIINEKKIKGLSEIIVAPNPIEGLKVLCQACGLGNLRHNCVMLTFPDNWQKDERWKQFMATLRCCQASEIALLVPKGIDKFPYRLNCKNKSSGASIKVRERVEMSGTVDMWCIVHDGGLLMLLAHLLIRARAWSKCSLRIFVVASETDNTINMKKEVTQFVYDLRITAEVEVVEFEQADISAYVFQRTMDMTMRKTLLENMNLGTNDTKREFQSILDKHHNNRKTSLDQPEQNSPPISNIGDNNQSGGAITQKDANNSSHQIAASKHLSMDLPAINVTDNDEEDSCKPTEFGDMVNGKTDEEEEEEILSNDLFEKRGDKNSAVGPGSTTDQVESQIKESNTEQTLILTTPDTTPSFQNQRSVTFAAGNYKPENYVSPERLNEFTFSPAALHSLKTDNAPSPAQSFKSRLSKSTRRMHNAVRLNEKIRERSNEASLVILNLPGPSRHESSDYNYMEYIESLTEGLERVLLVRGTGKEVITAYAE